jgi:hypothetical protein
MLLTAPQLRVLNSNPFANADYGWLIRHGAVATGTVDIQLVFQGNRTHTVRILNIKPVEKCTRPLGGTIFYAPSAGSDSITQLNINLDSPGAPASYTQNHQVNGMPEGKTISDYFGHNTVSLSNGEQFTFDIHASTALHYCQFTFDMTVVDGAKTVVETVDNHGAPFRVTAIYHKNHDIIPIFSQYSAVYLGGVATPKGDNGWTLVPPAQANRSLSP